MVQILQLALHTTSVVDKRNVHTRPLTSVIITRAMRQEVQNVFSVIPQQPDKFKVCTLIRHARAERHVLPGINVTASAPSPPARLRIRQRQAGPPLA